MSNQEKAEQFKKDIKEAFPDGLTFRQIWFIVKFAKVVRKFARNNSALYNLCNMTFRDTARFFEVEKISTRDGKPYKGLKIEMINGKHSLVDVEDVEE